MKTFKIEVFDTLWFPEGEHVQTVMVNAYDRTSALAKVNADRLELLRHKPVDGHYFTYESLDGRMVYQAEQVPNRG